jgi:hypothetical protein
MLEPNANYCYNKHPASNGRSERYVSLLSSHRTRIIHIHTHMTCLWNGFFDSSTTTVTSIYFPWIGSAALKRITIR